MPLHGRRDGSATESKQRRKLIRYTIFKDHLTGSFNERLEQVGSAMSRFLDSERAEGRLPHYAKVFLSDSANQEEQLRSSRLLLDDLKGADVTVIQQPCVDGAKLGILLKTSDEPKEFFLSPLRLTDAEATHQSSYVQTVMLFDKYAEELRQRGLSMSRHLVRTWIYVRDIDANYAGVVRARNDIFRQHGLTVETHFVASTGIGGRTGDRNVLVAMDFMTCPAIRDEQITYLEALDHLNPTHEYGVAFERGTRLSLDNGTRQLLISGTASIDSRGEVINIGDVRKQTARLMENIGALLNNGEATMDDIRYFIVYLRDMADKADVEQILESRFPQVPRILTLAEVCRPKWLVEMECVAVTRSRR